MIKMTASEIHHAIFHFVTALALKGIEARYVGRETIEGDLVFDVYDTSPGGTPSGLGNPNPAKVWINNAHADLRFNDAEEKRRLAGDSYRPRRRVRTSYHTAGPSPSGLVIADRLLIHRDPVTAALEVLTR